VLRNSTTSTPAGDTLTKSTTFSKSPLIITPINRIIISLATLNKDILIKAKTLRLNRIRLYKSISEGKYLR